MGIPVRVVGGEEGRGGRGALLEKGSPSPSRSPIPAENVYSGRYGMSPPPDARPVISPDRERSGRGRADKEPQPMRQMVGRQQGTDGEAEGRRGLKKEKRKTGRRGLLSAMPSHMKAAVGETGRGRPQAVPVSAQAATGKDRRGQRDRRCVPAAVLFIVKSSPPKSRETGIRGQACVPGRPSGTGRKGFGRERGPTESGRRPCPLRCGSYGQRQEDGNATGAAYCCFVHDFGVTAAAELRASGAELRGGEGDLFPEKLSLSPSLDLRSSNFNDS